ncbi:MAG: prepilin-type N-terminal cleavage/methylation domain-containing protein [Patescibacteria group bacterium]|nr:prepilin-type N-terminal cleavage/methylation domain-containing protein [Patescibacteria group bacterium]
MLSMLKFEKKNHQGFTLIELLVIIAIIGLLAAIGLVALQNAREKSHDVKRKDDAKQLSAALGLYFNGVGNGTYPTQTTFACLPASSLATDLISGAKSIMSNLPSDPLIGWNTVSTGCYAYRGGDQDFKIIIALENDTALMANDGGVLNNRYEIYTPGAQSWQP